jgi:hypothetical protein
MKDPRKSAALRWLAIGLVLLYVMFTLGVATVATPQASPGLFPNFYRAFEPLTQALPGAGLWPHLIDMRGLLGGVFSTPMAGVLVLGVLGFAALARFARLRKQLREEARIFAEETIRERARKGLR